MKTEEEDYGFAMVVNAPGDTTTVEFATASLKLDYVGQDEVDYPTYNVTLTATTPDGKSVSVTASALQAVAYDDATGEEIEIVEAPNALEDFEAGKTTLDITKPMYNAQGMLVDENYRGVVIQNGKKYLLR